MGEEHAQPPSDSLSPMSVCSNAALLTPDEPAKNVPEKRKRTKLSKDGKHRHKILLTRTKVNAGYYRVPRPPSSREIRRALRKEQNRKRKEKEQARRERTKRLTHPPSPASRGPKRRKPSKRQIAERPQAAAKMVR